MIYLVNTTGRQQEGSYAESIGILARAAVGRPVSGQNAATVSFDPTQFWQLTVVQDYGQFCLCSAADAAERADIFAAVEKAIDTDGIAQPATALLDFLQAGPAPVFIGFGSMTGSDGARLAETVTAAVRRAGVRAVVQAGWAGLAPVADDILLVDDLPRERPFPRTAAVVHHAGAGTTGAGLRAGVPGHRTGHARPTILGTAATSTRRRSTAPAPVRADPDTLAAAIRHCLDEPTYRNRVRGLGRRVRAEDGCADVLNLIAGLHR